MTITPSKTIYLSIITVTRSRPQLLSRAIDSLKSQSRQDFEWIVVNDGEDAATRKSILDAEIDFPHTYLSMVHPNCGFGLSYGRSRGLTIATGDIITYLDDDNTFKPNFVAETIAFFNRHPQVNYTMPIQQRRRDILKDGAVMSSGKEFLSSTSDCTIEQLIRHEQLIDSNGFAHRNSRDLSLMWNPDLKIYIDYEFLLKCISHWGKDSFAINPAILVDYIQTNTGVIGKSNYHQWATELEWILDRHKLYSCLKELDLQALDRLKCEYESKHQIFSKIQAFNN